MKILQFININFRIPIFIFIIDQVNASWLSRLKNRYEYLPLPLKKYNTEDLNDITDVISPTNISKATIGFPVISKQDTQHVTGTMSSENLNSVFLTAIQDSNIEKRTISADPVLYYDQDKWPAIKLFVDITSVEQSPSATDPTKRRKKTWPSYFPPKIISKLQAELDDALLPWKSTTPIPSNGSTSLLANLTENTEGDVIPLTQKGSVSYCYMCGLNEPGIPRMPGCYHIFENDDYTTRKLQRKYKVKCILSSKQKSKDREFSGPEYIGGCFKRFLDVGVEYNERGCRTKEPMRGKSYASKRLARLERILKYTDNGCVFSPHASLTPFSRAISLYARYHVCVCDTKYCNQAFRILPFNIYMSLTLYLLII